MERKTLAYFVKSTFGCSKIFHALFLLPIILLTLSFSVQSCRIPCPEIYPKAYEEYKEWLPRYKEARDLFISNDSILDTLKLSSYKLIGEPRSFEGSPVKIERQGKCYTYLAIDGNVNLSLRDLDVLSFDSPPQAH